MLAALSWQIPLGVFVAVAVYRLVAAPYWLHREQLATVQAQASAMAALEADRNRLALELTEGGLAKLRFAREQLRIAAERAYALVPYVQVCQLGSTEEQRYKGRSAVQTWNRAVDRWLTANLGEAWAQEFSHRGTGQVLSDVSDQSLRRSADYLKELAARLTETDLPVSPGGELETGAE